MSVWPLQGGVKFVIEFRVEGHCFIDKNLPTKKARTCPRSPSSEQNENWRPDPSHLTQCTFLWHPQDPTSLLFVCAHVSPEVEGVSPDLLVLNLTKHVGCFFMCEMGIIMRLCLLVTLLWDQRHVEKGAFCGTVKPLRYQEVLVFSSPRQLPGRGCCKGNLKVPVSNSDERSCAELKEWRSRKHGKSCLN